MGTAIGQIAGRRVSVGVTKLDDDQGIELLVVGGQIVWEYAGSRRVAVGRSVQLDDEQAHELVELLRNARGDHQWR